MTDIKAQLEVELLEAQKEKLLAEIRVLRRTTPFAESVKIVGSMILGIGGAIAALAGFQLAEVKSEKFKNEAHDAAISRDAALQELTQLTEKKAILSKEYSEVQASLVRTKTELGAISDHLSTPEARSNPQLLTEVRQQVNAVDIELRSAPSGKEAGGSQKTLPALISDLFAPTASVRGRAYEEMIRLYSSDPDLVPSLITYARENVDNENGVYNALVVLSHIDLKKLNADFTTVRSFAESVRKNGSKTSERVDKLLARLS